MNIKLECIRCGGNFQINTVHLKAVGLNQLPNACPSCKDKAQGRPPQKVVVRREMIQEWDRVEIALPMDWFQEFQAQEGDRPCSRAIVKGSIGSGVSWNGRIDLYDFRYNREGLGRVRLMEVEHESGEIHNEKFHQKAYKYLSIDPIDGGTYDLHAPEYALIFASVYYKSTLKGLGRQYAAGLNTEDAIWEYRLSSQCRSGRYGNEMAVAIVTELNSIIGTITGDLKKKTIWNLKNPYGIEI